MENFNDEFERSLQEAFRDAELEPSPSAWENIATSSDLKSNSFEGNFQDIFSEAQAKPSDDVWNQIAQSPELPGSLEQEFGAVFNNATLTPPPKVWANIEKQLHPNRFPKRVLWRVGGVAASLLLVGGLWWQNAETNKLLVNAKDPKIVNQKKKENLDNSLSKNNEISGQNSVINKIESEQNLTKNSTPNQENFVPQNNGQDFDNQNTKNVDSKNQQTILATSGYEETTQKITVHSSEKEMQNLTPETVEKIALLTPIQRLNAGLILAVNDFGEPVFVAFDIPNLSQQNEEKPKIKVVPFVGFSATSENFTPNFKGNESVILDAVQFGETPFTNGINSSDNDLYLSLQDSIFDAKSTKYGIDFGIEFENLLKKGSISLTSGAYLTQTEYTVQTHFVRQTVQQAQGEEGQLIENPLQNQTKLVNIPIQLVYTSGQKSNLGVRFGAGMETDFVLQNEWTNPSSELIYDFGKSQNINFNYVLSGGILYRLGKHAELGFDISRKEGLNSTYDSKYLTSKPLRIGYGGHFRIKF